MSPKKEKKKLKKRCIFTICAHNDDQLLGAGGTIRNYADKGITPYTFIFSYGESSHPHLIPKHIAKVRKKESLSAAEVLGDKIEYFGIKEGNFNTFNKQKYLKELIKKKKPEKIFTHSPDDPHGDHMAVFKIVSDILLSIKLSERPDLYSFDVWNLFSFKSSPYPKLFVDISDTFKYKYKAFMKHKSQFNTMILLGIPFYIKALTNGWNNHCRYAEVFHKIDPEDYSDDKKRRS